MNPEHLKIEACPIHRPGGQGVGECSPAISVEHIPTGLIAVSKKERSQTKNKNLCLSMLEWGLAEIGWKDTP